MSPRSRMVFPGRLPWTRATTPPPMGWGSRPISFSAFVTRATVSGSSSPSSGCSWICRRQAIIFSFSSFARS